MGEVLNSNKQVKFYSITKEGEIVRKVKGAEPYFVKRLEGRVVDIKIKDEPFEGKDTFKIQIYLEDDEARYCLSTGRYTGFGRDIISRLSSLDNFYNVSIGPYSYKVVIKGEEQELIGASVYANKLKVERKFAKEEVPAVVDGFVGKKPVKDTTDRDEFFDKKLAELVERIKAQAGTGEIIGEDIEEVVATEIDEDGDVPF